MDNVLIVDDAASTLKVYERILAVLPGVVTIPYTSSLSALWWCTDHDPDLVLVDYQMPEIDGLGFIERFRAMGKSRDIPIVMITSAEERIIRHKALDIGADDFLLKPIDHIELTVRVKNLLNLRRGSRMIADRAELLAHEVRRATKLIAEREAETIFRLTRIAEYKDDETANHIVRIGHYAGALAAKLGLPTAEQELLRLAAPMHDIGKVTIPDEILLKPGPLTPAEWEIMKTHSFAGFDILRDSPSPLLSKGAEIALSHHEQFDGGGYPFGLKGDKIPLSGRITALCDVFDALLSTRPYKDGWPISQAVAHLEQGSGKHFDPIIVDAFKSCMPEFVEIRHRYQDDVAA
jgi:putative two-component system response regulator